MDNTRNPQTMQRIHHRLAVVDSEAPNFMGIKNGVYLSSNDGKEGNVIYFEHGNMKYRTKNEVYTLPTKVSNLPGCVIMGEDTGKGLVLGCDNIFIGRGIADDMKEGNELISIGSNSLKDSSAIGCSIAIGSGVMSDCAKTEMNIGIGKDSLTTINDSYNIAIGIEAGKNMNGSLMNHNILLGRESMANTSGSSINIISIGSETASKLSGNNFQSIYIGDKVAQNLDSSVISVNNVGIGSETLKNSTDISDVICIGSMAGNKVSGNRSIILGTKACYEIDGSLSDDIAIGTEAGNSRIYNDSHSILIGSHCGKSGSGSQLVSIGSNSSIQSEGNLNVVIGSDAGAHSFGNENLCLGNQSGNSLKGSNNICLGTKSGYGLEGSKNIWIGEGPVVSDILNKSVVIGSQIFVKGNEAVVIGSQVGKSSTGFLNKDILIGANAGMGQKYNETVSENKGMLLIGANAGLGNPESPDSINSNDLVCLGHSAGHSNEQSFSKTVFVGNYAGSYATNALNCVVVGHSAGVAMSGESNIFIGPHTGFNVKGNRNILIGSHCGDQAGEIEADLENVLAIGHSNRPTILGDLERGNIIIGSSVLNLPKWTNGKGTLGFVPVSERPTEVSNSIGGVLYSFGKHLEYATDKRITNLTFPYKFISQGEMNGLKYSLNLDSDGGTLLTFKIVPSSKPHLYFSEEIMLNVISKKPILSPCKSENWKLSINEGILTVTCSEDLKGICYLEAVGIHINGTC